MAKSTTIVIRGGGEGANEVRVRRIGNEKCCNPNEKYEKKRINCHPCVFHVVLDLTNRQPFLLSLPSQVMHPFQVCDGEQQWWEMKQERVLSDGLGTWSKSSGKVYQDNDLRQQRRHRHNDCCQYGICVRAKSFPACFLPLPSYSPSSPTHHRNHRPVCTQVDNNCFSRSPPPAQSFSFSQKSMSPAASRLVSQKRLYLLPSGCISEETI